MKIQLNQAWENNGRLYKKYAVLEMSDDEGNALIAEGYGHRVPDDTRLFVSEHLITECVPTGEQISLEELTEQKPQVVPKSARFKL